MPVFQSIACLLLVVGATASAGADLAERDWHRYRVHSTQTTMVTDLDAAEAHRLLGEIDRFDALVDQFVAPFIPVARQIAPALVHSIAAGRKGDDAALQLVVMRRRNDFNRLFRSGHFAAFTIPELDRTVLVVGPMGGRDSLRENLLHEYVHYRLRRDVPGGLPLWYEEGLASFLSQVRFLPHEAVAGGAAAPQSLQCRYELGEWLTGVQSPDMPLSKLLAVRDLQGLGRGEVYGFYQTAHALVRHFYLLKGLDTEVLAASLVLGEPRFINGADFDLEGAAAAIRRLSGAGLRGREFRETRRRAADRREKLVGEVDCAPHDAVITASSVVANDVRETLAEATLQMNAPAAEVLYARVLDSEPARLSALLGHARALRLQTKIERAGEVLERASKLVPDAPELKLERSSLATSGCIIQRRPECPAQWQNSVFELREVLDAQPDNFEAIYRLGLAHLYIGQPGEALGYLEVAWRRVPWSARVNFFMGEAMRLLGDTRARWHLQNAQRWAGSDYFREAAKSALDRLEPAPSSVK